MNSNIVGRDDEKKLLDEIVALDKASLAIVYGRRRVGKTYLIKTHLKNQIAFEFSGIHNVSTDVQLTAFTKNLNIHFSKNTTLPTPNNWFDALQLLATLLEKKLKKQKLVVFLDEFPWIQTAKSNFLAAFENFWNTWAVYQPNLSIFLCGSAAGWMIKNVIRNKGGLHNRTTHIIPLMPFSLYETACFLQYKKIQLSRYQVIQLYMALGGIPQYLDQIKAGLSAAQIIDAACFHKNGFMFNEFQEIFASLFDNAERHIKVVKALANKPMGLSRTNIIKLCKLQSGGSTTALLDELSASGFISAYIPFGKKQKDTLYKLTDSFSLFYLKFMEHNKSGIKGTWMKLADTPSWKIWSGLAFENICLQHIAAIKYSLGIHGIYSENSIWRSKTNSAQIDLLIDRRDQCINLCEIKFYEADFSVDKKYAQQLLQKKAIFKQETKTRKQLIITLITSQNFKSNINSIGLIDQAITADALFLPMSLHQ